MEFHTALGSLRWGSPSPGRQCSSHASRSDRLSSPLCRKTDLQTGHGMGPWVQETHTHTHTHFNCLFNTFQLVVKSYRVHSAVNGWRGTPKFYCIPWRFFAPISKASMKGGAYFFFYYNDNYINPCPLIPEKMWGIIRSASVKQFIFFFMSYFYRKVLSYPLWPWRNKLVLLRQW